MQEDARLSQQEIEGLIEDGIQSVCSKILEAEGVKSGDIAIDLAHRLALVQEQLAEVLTDWRDSRLPDREASAESVREGAAVGVEQSAAEQEGLTLYRAEAQSRNFAFEGFGDSEASAKRCLEKGLRSHERHCRADGRSVALTFVEEMMEDARIVKMTAGECLRDYEPIDMDFSKRDKQQNRKPPEMER